MCSGPVGLGANRTLTFRFSIKVDFGRAKVALFNVCARTGSLHSPYFCLLQQQRNYAGVDMNMSGEGNQLLQKLDEFIRKYYLNQLIRGALLSTGLLVAFFLAFAVLEYYGRFGITGRTIFFYSLLLVSAIALTQWVVSPLIRLWNIRPGISYDEAASIVGKHFSNIEDRLLNTLQLQRSAANSQSELLMASIDQRITEMRPVPFATAIDHEREQAIPSLRIASIALVGFDFSDCPLVGNRRNPRLLTIEPLLKTSLHFYSIFRMKNSQL